MAYGLKYLCEYRSKMRGRLLYRIEIEERDVLPLSDRSAIRMRPCADVFTIKWGNADDPEYTPVKGSTLTLKILCMQDMQYLGLFTTDPRKYRLTVWEYRPAADGTPVKMMLWRGFLAANSYKEDFGRPPYVVTLTATDGLSLLGAMPFRDANGAKFTGVKSLYTLFGEMVDLLGIDMPCVEWTGLIESTGPESVPSFFGIHIDLARVYRSVENPTWRDVLELCTQPFNAQIFQARGVFHVRRILSLLAPERPVGFDPYVGPMQRERSSIHPLWRDGCDLNASTELNLLAPYRSAEVSLSNTNYSITDCYSRERWRMGRQMIVLSNRIAAEVLNGTNYTFRVGDFVESNATDISVSMEVYNGARDPFSTKGYDLNVTVCAATLKNGRYLYWNAEDGKWSSNSDDAWTNHSVEASKIPITSEYQSLQGVKSVSVKLDLQYIKYPDGDKDKADPLYVLLKFPHPADRFVRQIIIITNVEINISNNSAVDITKTALKINGSQPDSCQWNIPVRDGGYYANTLLPNVLLDSDGRTPIISWTAPTDRGTLMGITTNDILRLRANVSRQLCGEMRCPDGIDLNSLFLDGKFTHALYYVNSLELLAERQVYKVQLRELLDTRRAVRPFEWVVRRRFTNAQNIAASLNGVLFLLCGTNPFGVERYDTLTDELRTLPYTGKRIDIRKGQQAVVVQVGDTTELFALDNTGEVLSRMDSSVSDVLAFDTALYDADRAVWISYDSVTTPGKTVVTVFSNEMELHSQSSFDFVANGLQLMSNGYVVTAGDATYWHSYELHAPDALPAVNDPADPLTQDQWPALAVSDALLVKEVSNDALLEIGLRYGLKLKARQVESGMFPQNTYLTGVACNNRIVVCQGSRPGVPAEAMAYDAKTRKKFYLEVPYVAGVGVAGMCAYVLGHDAPGTDRVLYCLSFEETCYTNKPDER